MKVRLFAAIFLVLTMNLPAQNPGRLAPGDLGFIHLLGIGEFATLEAEMAISTSSGTVTRGVQVYLQNDGETRQVFARITDPPFLTRTRFLYIDRGQGRITRWIANSQGVRRIADSNTEERIFGSDFTAQDLSFLDMNEMEIRELPSAEDRLQLFLVADPAGVYPDRRITYDIVKGLAMEVSYLRGTETVKRYRVLETRESGGAVFPSRAEMADLEGNTHTLVTISAIDNTTPIPPRIFNRASLQ